MATPTVAGAMATPQPITTGAGAIPTRTGQMTTTKCITATICGRTMVKWAARVFVRWAWEAVGLPVTVTTAAETTSAIGHRGLTASCRHPIIMPIGCKLSRNNRSISVKSATRIAHPARCHLRSNWRSVSIDAICAIAANGWAIFVAWTMTKTTTRPNTSEFSGGLCLCERRKSMEKKANYGARVVIWNLLQTPNSVITSNTRSRVLNV